MTTNDKPIAPPVLPPHAQQMRSQPQERDAKRHPGPSWKQRARWVMSTLILMLSVIPLFQAQPVAAARSSSSLTITQYSFRSAQSGSFGITVGSDKNLWFSLKYDNQIGKVTPTGKVTITNLLDQNSLMDIGIASGSDGAIWYTLGNGSSTYSPRIGRITTKGVQTVYDSATAAPYDITAGPGGNLWFTDSYDKIGRITTSGTITEFPSKEGRASSPYRITAGPDGNLWFTNSIAFGGNVAPRIGKMTPTGQLTFYTLPKTDGPANAITVGPDGALWFTLDTSNKIGRITTAGALTAYQLPPQRYPYLPGITTGPDGALWFTDPGYFIGRITTTGSITEWPTNQDVEGIITGPDGHLWVTEPVGGGSSPGQIGRVTLS